MRRAFTLVEIAIVLFIVSIIIALGVTSLGKMSQGERYKVTKLYLQKLGTSTINFAMANGRLPCPDLDCDGYEDRCEEEWCDIDGDGEEDIAYGVCYADYYYTTGKRPVNDRCGDIDFSRGENLPPYLLPYATLGEKKSDAFQKPVRYDVNYKLAQTGDLERLCSLVDYLSSKSSINTNREINSTFFLPIVTGSKDTLDDELIENKAGYTVAALFISQGECPGVSGKNRGSNREYAMAEEALSIQDSCMPDTYSDIVGELTLLDLLKGSCQIDYPKKIPFYINGKDGSIELFDGKEWVCYNWKDLGYEEGAGLSFSFETRSKESVKFYPEEECQGESWRFGDAILVNQDGSAITRDGELVGGPFMEIFIDGELAGHVEDEEGDLVCEDLSQYRSVIYPIDARVGEIGFYKSVEDCKENRDRIRTLATLWNSDDKNRDRLLLLSGDGPRDNGFSKIVLLLGEGVSYLDGDGCHTVEDGSGKVVELTLFSNPFLLFPKEECSGDDHYLLNDIVATSLKEKNDGHCLLKKGEKLDCSL
ncbi:MAG: type II secretion system protein [Epsilonproteobacteria bacterium]|nr:hypothetical protein [Campylobacterota bacterium]NPA56402.1 type II secretion system protein [Campylobacterota bacterium]